jgi:hypothetical protein
MTELRIVLSCEWNGSLFRLPGVLVNNFCVPTADAFTRLRCFAEEVLLPQQAFILGDGGGQLAIEFADAKIIAALEHQADDAAGCFDFRM